MLVTAEAITSHAQYFLQHKPPYSALINYDVTILLVSLLYNAMQS